MKNIRIALVYDRVNKIGGAERVLEALHEIWPEAPLYTAVYNKRSASWADVFTVRPSFLQSIPFSKTHHEWFATVTPMAFETFSFDEFDIVISVTSAEAKNIITKPGTIHVCYCLTPTRYLWSGATEYSNNPHIGLPQHIVKIGLSALLPLLRSWDLYASRRPDTYVAISNRVKSRIETYYHQKVDRVIYPPVNTKFFTQKNTTSDKIPIIFYLVSRLVAYKHVDILEACTRLRLQFVALGSGHEKSRLKNL
jgi:glycosyltransferase involved in cell wall biosynthesis